MEESKKILICEDHELIAISLSRTLERKGYLPFILAKNYNPAYVINKIEETVRVCHPDYIILDGLDGLWVEGVEIAKKAKPDISAVILSGDSEQIKKAQKAGLVVFNKNDCSSYNDLCKFLNNN